MTATAPQSLRPSGSRGFTHTTTIGATARIGIVCEATMYGRNPRWSSPECASTAPRVNPTTAPRTKPTAASFAVKRAASKRTSISSGPLRREGSKSWPTMSWTCGIVRSFASNWPMRRPVDSANQRNASHSPQRKTSTARKSPTRTATPRIRSRSRKPDRAGSEAA